MHIVTFAADKLVDGLAGIQLHFVDLRNRLFQRPEKPPAGMVSSRRAHARECFREVTDARKPRRFDGHVIHGITPMIVQSPTHDSTWRASRRSPARSLRTL